MPLTTYLEDKLLDAYLGGTAYTSLGTVYFGLSTTAPNKAGGSVSEPSAQTTLTTALASGSAYTSLSVAALTGPVANGDSLTIGTGGTTQTVTASAAAAVGATTISVTSFTANAAYAVGTQVSDTTGAYARVAVTNNTTNFPAASGGSKNNGAAISWDQATASWGTVADVVIYDAPAGGNLLEYVTLGTSKSIASGDTPSLAASSFTLSIS